MHRTFKSVQIGVVPPCGLLTCAHFPESGLSWFGQAAASARSTAATRLARQQRQLRRARCGALVAGRCSASHSTPSMRARFNAQHAALLSVRQKSTAEPVRTGAAAAAAATGEEQCKLAGMTLAPTSTAGQPVHLLPDAEKCIYPTCMGSLMRGARAQRRRRRRARCAAGWQARGARMTRAPGPLRPGR